VFVVMNRFPVNPEYAEQFETRLRNRPQRVDRQQGFIQAQFLRPSQSDDPYIVLTVWESKADFEAWVKADSFTEKHAGRRTLRPEVFRGPNKVESFEIILDSHSTE
jgi:heme-degrading monooxygenase HmoA